MARWNNLIPRQEVTVNRRVGGMLEYRGLVLHTADGYYEGTISWEKNPSAQVSSHFVVGKNSGEWCQMMDDVDGAWTQIAGNYHWLSVENEGFGDRGQALTAWQVEANARLLAEAHVRHGVPLQIANSPTDKGLGHHSMGGTAWGHLECPGLVIIAQKAAIVDRAKSIISGGSDMNMTDTFTVVKTGETKTLQDFYSDFYAELFSGKGGPYADQLAAKLDAIAAAASAAPTQDQVSTATAAVMNDPTWLAKLAAALAAHIKVS